MDARNIRSYIIGCGSMIKVCPKCGKTKLNTEFYPYESGGHHWTYWCKECVEEYIKNVSVGAN